MKIRFNRQSSRSGFTVAEIVMCFAVMSVVIGGILTTYTHSSVYSERAGYALAAQAQAVQVAERVRAAVWDTQSTPPVDNTTNFPAVNISLLELPVSGTNAVYATNTLAVSNIVVSTTPVSVSVKLIQVVTTWPWNGVVMSNTMVVYRAPDQ